MAPSSGEVRGTILQASLKVYIKSELCAIKRRKVKCEILAAQMSSGCDLNVKNINFTLYSNEFP